MYCNCFFFFNILSEIFCISFSLSIIIKHQGFDNFWGRLGYLRCYDL